MNDEDKKIADKLEPLYTNEIKLVSTELLEEALRKIALRAYRAGFADGAAHANIRTTPNEEPF